MKSTRLTKFTHAKNLSLALCAALTLSGAAAVEAQSVKVGVVDMNKVFNGYYKTKDAEKKMVDSRDGSKKELDDRLENHKQMIDEINQLNKDVDNPTLSAGARSEKQKKRETKINEVRQFEQSINEFKTSREKQLQEQVARMRNTIVEEIMVVVNAKVKSDNYDLVLDKSGLNLSGVQVVLFSNARMEFTDDVISALNRPRPAASASPVPTATPAGSPRR